MRKSDIYNNVLLLLAFLMPSFLFAQNSVKPQYTIDGNGFECFNGANKYTRALYCGTSGYRIETSDRPIFGVYTKKVKRNIRFYLNAYGREVPLDSLDCLSKYANGCRSYIETGWGTIIDVKPLLNTDGALFAFFPRYHDDTPTLKAVISVVKNPKMKRNGDMGLDSADSFDPARKLKEYNFGTMPSTPFVIKLIGTDSLTLVSIDEYSNALKAKQSLSTINVNTPDSLINAAVNALPFAANGIWDGRTFRHGAVGWRTELPGWRGAYIGDVLGWRDRVRRHFDYYSNEQIKDVPPIFPHPTQDSSKNLARAEKRWGTQMYSNGYITSNRKLNHYDMNLVYIDELLWHFQFDADTAYMRKMWHVIKSSLEWEKRNFDPDGDHLYDAYACIWASDALYYNGGAVTHSSAYNYRANLLAAKIARLIGEDDKPYQAEADAILKAMNRQLWVDSLSHWAEYKDKMGLRRVHNDAALWSYYTPIDEGILNPIDFASIDKLKVPTSWGGYVYRTSDWQPYAWSINNVAAAENYHLALAFFEAGEKQRGYELLRNTMLDNMVYGHSPGNYGQLLTEDEHRGECYRDFADCIGIASRAIVEGLFGIVPDAIDGKCYIRPGFPESWDSVSVSLPYISYKYSKSRGVYDVVRNFPQHLQIIVDSVRQTPAFKPVADSKGYYINNVYTKSGKSCPVNLDTYYNARVCDLYNNRYMSPRPDVTTLELPVQGAGDWCSTDYKPTLTDSSRVVYTSLWDNYPDSVVIPVDKKAERLDITLFGTTNWMQSHIANGVLTLTYSDGSQSSLFLVNPDNWLPEDKPVHITMSADRRRKIKTLTLKTLSNDVVIGIMNLNLVR